MKWLVDYTLGRHPLPPLLHRWAPSLASPRIMDGALTVCLSIVLLAVLNKLSNVISNLLLLRAGERIVFEIRCAAFDQLQRLSLATKAGRRLPVQTTEGYNRKNLTAFVNRSLKNLNTDTIDLLQLHCPPTEVYYRPEVFGVLDDLVKAGKLRHYGVSVEKVEEAIKAIEFPNVQSVQIIFNIFRQRPAELFFAEAQKRKVGILARVPLASGLLSGRMSPGSKFAKDDHRNFNRHGEAFDRGETFSGVDFETGLSAVEQLKKLVPVPRIAR